MKIQLKESNGDILIFPQDGESEEDILLAMVIASYRLAPYRSRFQSWLSERWPIDFRAKQARKFIKPDVKKGMTVVEMGVVHYKSCSTYLVLDEVFGERCFRLRTYRFKDGPEKARLMLVLAQEILNSTIAEKPLIGRLGQVEEVS